MGLTLDFKVFSIKHDVAVIRPFQYEDPETGETISLTVSPRYSTLTIGDTEYYFLRESGEFDGTGTPTKSVGSILIYDAE